MNNQAVDYPKLNQALGNNLGDKNLGGIISAVLPTLLSLAGLILFPGLK